MRKRVSFTQFCSLGGLTLFFWAFQFASSPAPSHSIEQTNPLEATAGRELIFIDQAESLIELCGLQANTSYKIQALATDGQDPVRLRKKKGEAAADHLWLEPQKECVSFEVVAPQAANQERYPVYISYAPLSEGKRPGRAKSNNASGISTEQVNSVDSLVRNVFISGNCYNISNVTAGGSAASYGTFSNGSTSIGIESGIILATGEVSVAHGPNDKDGASSQVASGNTDPDLDLLAANVINDVVVLEFDFVPTEDHVEFEYVFASEEYCEYVNSIFNDVFGFFISGPGINGPFSNGAINIATMPNFPNIEVSVNTVNHTSFPGFYEGNIPAGSPQLTDIDCEGHPISSGAAVEECQFDGFTRTLTAEADVIPCETYHIKLAICDVGDSAWDAAVFLKANSFNAGGDYTVQAVGSQENSNELYEGCTGYFEFIRTDPSNNQPLTISFQIGSGSATPDNDYPALPTSITIPAGETSVLLPVEAVEDAITEGSESIEIIVDALCECDGDSTVVLFIEDPVELELQLEDQQVCEFTTTELDPAPLNGAPPYTYQWSTGDESATLSVALSDTIQQFSVTVTDACGNTGSDELQLFPIEGPVAEINVVATPCFNGSNGSMEVNISGGAPPYVVSWSNGSTELLAEDLADGDYSVTVEDANGCQAIAVSTLEEDAPLACTPVIFQQVSTFNGSDGSISVIPPLGVTVPYSFEWSNNATIQTLDNLSPGTYSVTVTGSNDCQATCSITLLNPSKVGDRVWNDFNENGRQDLLEPGVPNVTVSLLGVDMQGNDVAMTTQTNGTGLYTFDGLASGNYSILFSDLPNGFEFTSPNIGDDNSDSDANADGVTPNITLPEGVFIDDIDAGIFDPCENVTDPGQIAGDEYLCGPGNDPSPIIEIEPATGGVGAIEYVWMQSEQEGPFADGIWQIIPNSNSPGYDPGPIDFTTYFARCVRREGCIEFLEANIVVKKVGDEAVALIEGPATICVGESVTFSAGNGGQGASYSWSFGNNATPATANTQTASVTWSSYGVYTVNLTVETATCTSYAKKKVFVTNSTIFCNNHLQQNAGIPKAAIPDQELLQIYPNPAQDLLNIQIKSDVTTDYPVQLLHPNGQVLRSIQLPPNAPLELNLSDLPSGIYYIQATLPSQKTILRKLIKN
jgi:hypothetical protein